MRHPAAGSGLYFELLGWALLFLGHFMALVTTFFSFCVSGRLDLSGLTNSIVLVSANKPPK